MDKAALYHFLSQHRYGVVSSISEDGVPQSALVGIAVTKELEVVFDTLRTTRKYRNLVARPACSFVIGWAGEQTVQLEGFASEPTGCALRSYQAVYFSVWKEGPARMNWPQLTYIVVKPRWIRYSDFDQRPPLIEELDYRFPSIERSSETR
jgi:hypothetical protein